MWVLLDPPADHLREEPLSRYVKLARSMAFLEQRLRSEESPHNEISRPPS